MLTVSCKRVERKSILNTARATKYGKQSTVSLTNSTSQKSHVIEFVAAPLSLKYYHCYFA